jgi:hypothetical protein
MNIEHLTHSFSFLVFPTTHRATLFPPPPVPRPPLSSSLLIPASAARERREAGREGGKKGGVPLLYEYALELKHFSFSGEDYGNLQVGREGGREGGNEASSPVRVTCSSISSCS